MLRSKEGTMMPKTDAEKSIIMIIVGRTPRMKRLLYNQINRRQLNLK